MKQQIAIPNALVLILDTTVGDVPKSMGGRLVTSTASCIAVGSRALSEGPTEIDLIDGMQERTGLIKVFDGIIETPSQTVSICTVLGDIVMQKQFGFARSRIVVWVDDQQEPSKVEVQVAAVNLPNPLLV